MTVINSLIEILRIYIIPSGVILRVIYCLIKMMGDDDIGLYKKRIVTIIIFGIVAELVLSIKDVVEYYY